MINAYTPCHTEMAVINMMNKHETQFFCYGSAVLRALELQFNAQRHRCNHHD